MTVKAVVCLWHLVVIPPGGPNRKTKTRVESLSKAEVYNLEYFQLFLRI